MYKTIRLCDFCGKEMPPIEEINELSLSATQEWDLHGWDICEICALKLDNAFLKFKNQVFSSMIGA